jgi:hypothetical protein
MGGECKKGFLLWLGCAGLLVVVGSFVVAVDAMGGGRNGSLLR